VAPFKEHEYRDHLEHHVRVKTPRQPGMEGPGPGSPPSSPRALLAAKAHVRFRSRPHSAIVDAREQQQYLQQAAESQGEAGRGGCRSPGVGGRRERQVMEPGLYPAAGLLLGGLLRPRSEAYASKEKLPGLGLGVGVGAGAGSQDAAPRSRRPSTAHAPQSASAAQAQTQAQAQAQTQAQAHDTDFFGDLANNANRARRFHRKAPLSSGDAHRGESATQQKRKPANEKMRRVLESDDLPDEGDRGRGAAAGRGVESPRVDYFQVA